MQSSAASPGGVAPSGGPAPDAMDEFRSGVTSCLRSWHPLRTAVEGGWGGAESTAKAETLRSSIFSQFDGSKPASGVMAQEEIEDELAVYMEEQFSIVLEDGSERQVADAIWRMYEECSRGDFSLARRLVQNGEMVVSSLSVQGVAVQEGEEMEEDENGSSSDTARAFAADALFGAQVSQTPAASDLPPARQLGEAQPEKPAVQMDDDGFAPVVSRRKKG